MLATARILEARQQAADVDSEFIDLVEQHRVEIQERESGDLDMPAETALRHDELVETKIAAERCINAASDELLRMRTQPQRATARRV